jgi:hypothetical protein
MLDLARLDELTLEELKAAERLFSRLAAVENQTVYIEAQATRSDLAF